MRIGVDIDNTLTEVQEKLNEAAYTYVVSLGKNLDRYDKFMQDEKNDGTKYAKRFQFNYEELKITIEDLDYDIIISSPLIRAKHTSMIINAKNKNILIDNRLEERNPGDLNSKTISYTNREEYWNYYTRIKYGTSENIQDFFKRVYDFLDELKTKNYKSVLIVAHSGVSKAFSGYFEGIKEGKFLNRGLKNCEIKIYEL